MNPGSYLSGFLQGTRKALSEANKESITISINELNEFTLGALIALFERSVSIYAELININAYDQPGVEAGKIAAAEVIIIQDKITQILKLNNEISIDGINSKLENDSRETAFSILRSMYVNQEIILKSGSWSDPKSLVFTSKAG